MNVKRWVQVVAMAVLILVVGRFALDYLARRQAAAIKAEMLQATPEQNDRARRVAEEADAERQRLEREMEEED